MKLFLALGLVLMLSTIAMATPETATLGPYTVSFDLNTGLQYQLMTSEPVQAEGATIYGLQIFTDNTTKAIISIDEFDSPKDSTMGLYKQLAVMEILLNSFNVTDVEDRTIDGNEGFLASGVPLPQNTFVPADARYFRAIYWLDSKSCECGPVSVGTTSVDVKSSYPDDVTESLIGSLHVEKTASQAMPPA
ncbi:Uncharacterised protein [uncultured archaeon]|nr:Uncharacterised protein [uncultured archaeon]